MGLSVNAAVNRGALMLVEAEIWSIARVGQNNAVLIKPVESEVAVPIYIDQYQTQSILMGLGGLSMERPLTHDLLLSMLSSLDVQIDRIEITNLKDGIYYAQIVLERGGEKLIIDSRPSDSIALAVRIKCPIFIAESVVEEAAEEISTMTGESVAQNTPVDQLETDALEEKLKEAIEEENYELATVLRDKLQELKTGES